jgi:succinoglycan biosynthesis transport protein ExoP
VRAAQANVAQLEKQFEEAKAKLQQVNRKEFDVQQLDRDVQANRQLYDTFLTRAKQTDVGSGDVQAATARVVDPAIPPGGAIWPDKKRILGTSLLLALLAGIGIAFFLERLDNTLKTGEDVEEKLHEPVLGILPALRQQGAKRTPPERAFIDQNQSHFAEAIRTVRTSVLLSGLDNPHKCVLVTSSLVGEGKTTVAMNLAFALAHLQKVLLIDADMRRPSLGEMCGFNRDAPGLSNLIAGTASAAECIRKVADSDVHVLPAGIIPPNPLELLSSQKVALLLEKLGNIYERIVIDSAPAQIVSDPLVLAQHANAVIYVAKADVTPYQVVSAGIKRLLEVDAPVIGVVLNRVDLEKVAKYGKYGYYKQYYANYGYYRKAS